MTDYIKREDALKALREYPATKLKTAIRRLPSADVAPVRHGRWEEAETWYTVDGYIESVDYQCTSCGIKLRYAKDYPYCPNCGARMD